MGCHLFHIDVILKVDRVFQLLTGFEVTYQCRVGGLHILFVQVFRKVEFQEKVLYRYFRGLCFFYL